MMEYAGLFCFVVTLGVISALLVVGNKVFIRKNDVNIKRKWWPRYVVAFGAFLAAHAIYLTINPPETDDPIVRHGGILGLIALTIAVFTLRKSKFCSNCSALLPKKDSKNKFCSRCGEEIPS